MSHAIPVPVGFSLSFQFGSLSFTKTLLDYCLTLIIYYLYTYQFFYLVTRSADMQVGALPLKPEVPSRWSDLTDALVESSPPFLATLAAPIRNSHTSLSDEGKEHRQL
jgi:hypothetical protein